MIEQEWMQFTRTGSVMDYLVYSRVHEMEAANVTQEVKESEGQDGAEHCAYRYGVSSDTHRGL